MTDPILVWRFHEAPPEFAALSPHGGDEDWLAVVPADFREKDNIGWTEGGRFGCCDTSEHLLEDGRVVLIGAHA